MGLTENQKRLIQSISENNMPSAKKCAIACLTEDTTAKNKTFCNRYKAILTSSATNLLELPYDLKDILSVEDVSVSFKESRYYLSEKEKAVFEHILRMKSVNAKLMEMGIPYLNSTLLYGESGTGKTTFGRYVAYKTGLPFAYLNFSSLIDSYMGNTSKNISKAFSYALSNPCVFMLDEIDCISIRRSEAGAGASAEMARITISLMQELDRIPNDVIILAATNRIDRMDEALLRRFSLKHEVKRLNREERKIMAEKFFLDVGYNISDNELADIVRNNCAQAEFMNHMVTKLVECLLQNEKAMGS